MPAPAIAEAARRALTLGVAAALSVALVSSPAAAQKTKAATGRWQQIGTTSSNNPVFLDPKSVKKDAAGIITATVRVQFVEPVQTPQGAWTSARTVAMFDCAHHTAAVKENTYYLDERSNRVAQHNT